MTEQYEPIDIVSGDFSKGLLLLCDHASNRLPAVYGTLGLDAKELERHIAYDIGAEGVTRGLAFKLDVPAILTRYSRLLIDPNRGEDDPTLVRQLYDGTVIPGNYPLSKEELTKRVHLYFKPYHQEITAHLRKFETMEIVPAVIAIHTMTDVWNCEKRPWHASVLWDSDPRLAKGLLEGLAEIPDIVVGDNEPYDGALGGDTMYTHCTMNGLSHALIEIRQDLVSDQSGIDIWAERLYRIIEKLSGQPHNHVKQFYGSRALMPARRAK